MCRDVLSLILGADTSTAMTTIKEYPSAYTYVLEFHETYGATIRTEPVVDIPEKALRISLLEEELEEYAVAWRDQDIVEMADALGDFVYVAYGAAITHGVDADAAMEKIQKTAFHKRHLTSTLTPTPVVSDGAAAFTALATALGKYVVAVEGTDADAVAEALAECIDASYLAAEVHGIALDPVLEEIQRSNLSKLGADGKPIYREDGKILKGPNFFTPDLVSVLARQGQ